MRGVELAAKTNMDPMTPVNIAARRAYDLLDRLVELRASTIITDDSTYFVQMDLLVARHPIKASG